MAAYPLFYSLTWSEFREKLVSEYGVRVEVLQDGDRLTLATYLERDVDGKTLVYPFPVTLADDERLMPSTVRTFCEYLHLPKAEFGLTLG